MQEKPQGLERIGGAVLSIHHRPKLRKLSAVCSTQMELIVFTGLCNCVFDGAEKLVLDTFFMYINQIQEFEKKN